MWEGKRVKEKSINMHISKIYIYDPALCERELPVVKNIYTDKLCVRENFYI